MKKYIIIAVSLLVLGSCMKEKLDTVPTDAVSGTTIFTDTKSAMVALNGLYRAMYIANSDWFGPAGNVQQDFGHVSHNMTADLMGEDFVQAESGNGWFYFDYKYDVRSRYNSTSWRPYAIWNHYYKEIANANYIIGSEKVITGDEKEIKSIIGQALAVRAHAYFYLVRFYQQTYVGNETKPGVPLYTEPTTSASEGKGRGTLQEVYTQITADLERAATLLKESGVKQVHKSHADYYVVKGIQARVYLTMNKWAEAAAAAKEALTQGLKIIKDENLASGFNKVALPSVMWGAEIITTEAVSGGWGTFYCHIDPGTKPATIAANGYGVSARKCIDASLYAKIPLSDKRRDWWYDPTTTPSAKDADSGPCGYAQKKYYYANISDYTGDMIFMRAEEMMLIAAEAECNLKNFAEARKYLTDLCGSRDAKYAERLAKFPDASTYNTNTQAEPNTLMDEILFQRRIELWGEAGRIFDLQRLKLGFTRSYTGSNHSDKLTSKVTTAGSKEFILPIPQKEFDGNINMDPVADQNPW